VELNRIHPGQSLVMGRELTVPQTLHTVGRGENLGMIAQRYGTTTDALIRANQLANPSLIVPNQELVILLPSQAERLSTPSAMGMAAVEDDYYATNPYPTTTEKWIDVDLSQQRVVAYEGETPVRSFIIASGLPGTPTVTGTFRIWAKVPVQDMYGGNRAAGDYYYIEDVQWVQYFYQDYAFHAAPWNNNLGRPGSRGCINMRTEDARWLYDWAGPNNPGTGWLVTNSPNEGTLVVVRP
jgi:LysM repeat protein